jgi:MoxR-like ATPase
MSELSKETIENIKSESARWSALRREIHKVIVGQDSIIEALCIGLICNGHILLEGVPGLAKTTLIKTFSNVIDLSFQRIQFTPDLLPSDIVGTLIYNPKTHEFYPKKGPIFSNFVLADEINRAPAKVQSALLEAMQEGQVTIGDETFKLPNPFLVLATQNPIEQEGTYRLPEAQVDRFMFKVIAHYPTPEEEKEVIKRVFEKHELKHIFTSDDIAASRSMLNSIYIDDKIVDYIVALVGATRNPSNSSLKNLIQYGASPRASLTFFNAARAYAFLRGRHFVIPDDVKAIAHNVLRHRIIISYEAEADNITNEHVIDTILQTTPSP